MLQIEVLVLRGHDELIHFAVDMLVLFGAAVARPTMYLLSVVCCVVASFLASVYE